MQVDYRKMTGRRQVVTIRIDDIDFDQHQAAVHFIQVEIVLGDFRQDDLRAGRKTTGRILSLGF